MQNLEVLVDTNVFEDVLTGRRGVETSSQVLDLVRSGAIKGWVSSTVPIVLYSLRRKRGEDEGAARERVRAILRNFSMIPFRKATFDYALGSVLPEFEDNIQIGSASAFGLDAVVTRNKKHFVQEDIPVYTPEECIRVLKEGERKKCRDHPRKVRGFWQVYLYIRGAPQLRSGVRRTRLNRTWCGPASQTNGSQGMPAPVESCAGS